MKLAKNPGEKLMVNKFRRTYVDKEKVHFIKIFITTQYFVLIFRF